MWNARNRTIHVNKTINSLKKALACAEIEICEELFHDGLEGFEVRFCDLAYISVTRLCFEINIVVILNAYFKTIDQVLETV